MMIPAGYMFKKVATRPQWLDQARHVVDIHSVSGCISPCFADYIDYWRHNGHWLFDDPNTMLEIAAQAGIDLASMTLFYYELHEQEFHEEPGTWSQFTAKDFPVCVLPPADKQLRGFDVATFSARTKPECSPLSCNAICMQVAVNDHCLFSSFAEAKSALEGGLFRNAEPGPYRVFAVYAVGWEMRASREVPLQAQ